MEKVLPFTPAETLDISTLKLRLKTAAMVRSAELFGFWKHPDKDAATSFDEMTLKDIYYWVYKSKNPITRPEKGQTKDALLATDASIVRLPEGFSKTASVTMGAGGDLFRSKSVEHSKDVLFENVSDLLFEQDIAYANFESPITDQALVDEVIGDSAAPIECCSSEQFDILKGHKGKNFTVLNTCNNHIFDMGIEGIEKTQKVFAQNEIMDVGTNRRPEEYGKAKILTENGIKIGFVSAAFGLNGHEVPEEDAYRINVSKLLSKFADPDLDLLKRQIDHCKEEACDFVIASIHWGFEFEFFPRKRQVAAARELVEYGVDAILCHHPHVVQPVEYYRTKRDPNRVAVIAYSLGSMTWGFMAPHIVLSAIVNMTLSKGTIDGETRTYIEEAKVTPVFQNVFVENGAIHSRLEILENYLNEPNGVHSSAYMDQIKEYAALVLGAGDVSAQRAAVA